MPFAINQHEFEYPTNIKDTYKLKEKSGVYVILNASLTQVVYVGESSNVKSRVENHHRESCWKKREGTQIAVCYVGEKERKRIEGEIRETENPPCNLV